MKKACIFHLILVGFLSILMLSLGVDRFLFMDNIHAAWWKLYVDVPYEDIVFVSLSVLYITSCVESCRLAGFLLGVEIWKNIIIFMVIWKSLEISWKVWKFYKNCLKSPVKSGKIFKTILVEIFGEQCSCWYIFHFFLYLASHQF